MFKSSSRSIPVITTPHQMIQFLQSWRKPIGTVLQRPMAPSVPWNFSLTNKRGGFQLSWAQVPDADGYEVLRSDSGDFSGAPGSGFITIPIRSGSQTAYFDSVGGGPVQKYFKVRATAGTTNAPYSLKGNPSGALTLTSIDASDTMTASTTVTDGATNQTSQTGTGGTGTKGGSPLGSGFGGLNTGGTTGGGGRNRFK